MRDSAWVFHGLGISFPMQIEDVYLYSRILFGCSFHKKICRSRHLQQHIVMLRNQIKNGFELN